VSYYFNKTDVLFNQRILKSEGFYVGALDGIWGPKTNAANEAHDTNYLQLRRHYGELDSRTERNIQTLSIKAQALARQFMNKILDFDYNVKIISGTRTYAEQNDLYKIGRYGNPGKIVTKAIGGRSYHNFGIAWDVGIFYDDGSYLQEPEEYAELNNHINMDIFWGGNFKTIYDAPHYQLKTQENNILWVRNMFESGNNYLA